jgi:hypothetical protein
MLWETTTVAGIFAGCNRVAAWIDNQLIDDDKKLLSAYLNSGKWINSLRSGIFAFQRVFLSIFGDKYFSIICMRRSAIITTVVTIVLLIWFYTAGRTLDEQLWTFVRRNIPRLCLALIFDYLSIMRVRKALSVLGSTKHVGIAIVASVLLEMISVVIAAFVMQKVATVMHHPMMTIGDVLARTESEGVSGLLDDIVIMAQMGNLTGPYMYAAFAPSMWLLLYIMSMLLIKLFNTIAPLLMVSVQHLRFKQPVRIIGNVAGIVLCAVYLLCMLLLRIEQNSNHNALDLVEGELHTPAIVELCRAC